ncbi:MAG: hypothetical protein E6J60_15615 [Deltaproteobacteria bacterium]|nr:MAG: hypothetical protein E6J60_15615 [Deltaproteobacteria bacterium]
MVDKARRSAFVCQQCGHAAPRWLGQCPGCGAWSTMVEEALPEPRARGARAGAPGGQKPRPLAAVTAGAALRRTTGLAELDRVLGGGLVAGSVVLVGGDPGIGKSTLALQACGALARQGLPVLYVAGEESPEQVRLRALDLGMQLEVPGDEPRGAGAAAPALDRGARGRLHRRVGGEPEVVVGGEEEDATAVEHHLGVGRARERAQAAAEPRVLERRELRVEDSHAAVMPGAPALVNLERSHG